MHERAVNVTSVHIAVCLAGILVLGQGHGDSHVAGDGDALGLVADAASDGRRKRSAGLD